MKRRLLVLDLIIFSSIMLTAKIPSKIVGLVPARNESLFLPQFLKALSLYTDAIVYLDDASTDDSLHIVDSLRDECNVEIIIAKDIWYRDEPGDRNKLLQAGRRIGGTHFICLDVDEMFTANCLNNDFLRRKILSMNPGDRMQLTWIQLWRSIDYYRFDKSKWTNYSLPCVFCDNNVCAYKSDFIHTTRTPKPLNGSDHSVKGYKYGVMHFQFVNWRNLLIKQCWYQCLERIRHPKKSIKDINKKYAPSKSEKGLWRKEVPRDWFKGYDFINRVVFEKPEVWREKQILSWFEKYGRDYFSQLDIWKVDWGKRFA